MADAPRVLEAFVIDANGIARGKWIPASRIPETLERGIALPRSVYALDIWGCDVVGAGLAFGTGDPDGICLPVEGTLAEVPWLARPTSQLLLRMVGADRTTPFYGDPRQVLANVAARFRARNLTPVVATELEFYLVERGKRPHAVPVPPHAGHNGWEGWQTQVLSIAELHAFEAILADIFSACAIQGVPADTALRENGPAQFEVNLEHVADPVKAADHAVLLKRIVKGVARRHGLEATFMAKPYGSLAGSGMHAHISLIDGDGRNVLATGTGEPAPLLHHAVGGLLATLPECMLLFAPHLNSYRRFRPGAHAPTRASWGIDNRTAAVRVIVAGGATRFEHRIAGADCNPYLAIAGILAGALHGIETAADPGEPIGGDQPQDARAPSLPTNFDEAVGLFAQSGFASFFLGERYQRLFVACKRQEQAEFLRRVTDVEYDAYLQTS